MSYKILSDTTVLRLSDNACVPFDERNNDYREYQIWLGIGNTPLPADPEPVRETALTPSQQIILADGEDVAKVTITGEPGATVDYTVNGVPFQTVLDAAGSDVIELDCDTPNTTLVVLAGTARAVIFAVEVPA